MVEGEGWGCRVWNGGEPIMKMPWGWKDLAALLLALLTFGVIVAVLVQNFLNVE